MRLRKLHILGTLLAGIAATLTTAGLALADTAQSFTLCGIYYQWVYIGGWVKLYTYICLN